jgi:flagellar protein FlbD
VIVVTTLNGRPAAVNAELVERIHENPDTTLVLVDGKRLVVRESMAEVIGLIDQAKARVLRLAAARPKDAPVHAPEVPAEAGPASEKPNSAEPDPAMPDLAMPDSAMLDPEKIGR